MLSYVWLSLAIVCLWLSPQVSGSRRTWQVVLSTGLLLVAVRHAHWAGILTPIGVLAILAFGLLCYGYSHRKWNALLNTLTTVLTVVFSLALMAHIVPGFSNVLIVRDAVLSSEAVPYTLFLNFDKAQIGLFLLAFGPPLIASRAEWLAMFTTMVPRLVALVGIVMVCAVSIGQVRFDPKWPAFFPIWAWANLLFTCAAEEALFRGVIQRRLQGIGIGPGASTPREIGGLLIAGVLFGVAHFAGGGSTIVLATLAGIGYGWIYWRTNRIEGSILAHFLLNTTHILFFTYPALK